MGERQTFILRAGENLLINEATDLLVRKKSEPAGENYSFCWARKKRSERRPDYSKHNFAEQTENFHTPSPPYSFEIKKAQRVNDAIILHYSHLSGSAAAIMKSSCRFGFFCVPQLASRN